MRNYKRITIDEHGISINKDLYTYIKHYKEPSRGNLNNSEFNYYLEILERKSIEDYEKMHLVRWNSIKSWVADKSHIEILFKYCKKPLILEHDYSLISSLENYCYTKGKVIEKQSFYDSKIALYLFYLVAFIICYILMKKMN